MIYNAKKNYPKTFNLMYELNLRYRGTDSYRCLPLETHKVVAAFMRDYCTKESMFELFHAQDDYNNFVVLLSNLIETRSLDDSDKLITFLRHHLMCDWYDLMDQIWDEAKSELDQALLTTTRRTMRHYDDLALGIAS